MKRGDQCQGNYTFLLNFKGANKAGSVAAALSFHVPNFDFVLLALFEMQPQELLVCLTVFVCEEQTWVKQ